MRLGLKVATGAVLALTGGACDSKQTAEQVAAGTAGDSHAKHSDAASSGSSAATWPWVDGIPASRTCSEAEQLQGLRRPTREAARCIVGGVGVVKATVLVKPGGQVRRVLLEGERTDAEASCIVGMFDQVSFECARAAGFVRTVEISGNDAIGGAPGDR